MVKHFILYGSEGCHLCELAEELCQPILASNIRHVDIVSDERLVEQFGVHIPVLQHEPSGKNLFWPFTQGDVEEFANQWN